MRRNGRILLAFLLAAAVIFAAGCRETADSKSETEKPVNTERTVTETGSEATETPAPETETETEEETLPPEPEYELKLSDTYRPNGISFSTFEVSAGDLTVRCPSISGLLDETVSRRINVSLFERVIQEAEALSELYPEGITALSSSAVLDASFSNVISVRTTFLVEEAPENGNEDRPLIVEFSENYELLTGHPFRFQDLFREGVTASDLFGPAGERFQTAKVKSARTLEVLNAPLSDYADVAGAYASIAEAFDTGAEIPFRFDEKEASIVIREGNVIYEASVPYLDFMPETVIYAAYLTENPVYAEEPEESYPVLVKRFPSQAAVFEDSENAFVDAVLYAPDAVDGEMLRFITEDAKARLEERIRAVKEGSDGYVMYNAELSLYEMKNGFMNGKPAPVYISVREYVRATASEEEFNALKAAAVKDLQERSEEEAALQKTLFLGEEEYGAERHYAAWYYDEAGAFIEESVLLDPVR